MIITIVNDMMKNKISSTQSTSLGFTKKENKNIEMLINEQKSRPIHIEKPKLWL